MSGAPVVSIVGRPNVGKSFLFNRILGKRIAVVDDFPGVTRDRNYMKTRWNNQEFLLVDTGGLILDNHESIPEAIHEQVSVAVEESAVVLFTVDALAAPTDLDMMAAKQLRRRAADKVLLVVNKAESRRTLLEIDSFRGLGLGDPFPVSALQGMGVADLLDKIVELLKARAGETKVTADERPSLKLAVVGRPNAGKSSLVNKLLKEKRMIVDDKPGTTRDSIDTRMEYEGRQVVLIDTAGLRKKSHVKQDLEYYSNLRALDSIGRADIAVVMIDATIDLGLQDLRIVKKIYEMRKGLLLAFNKWDIKEKGPRTFDAIVKEVRRLYMELRPVPMLAVSALNGRRIHAVIDTAFAIKARMETRVPAAQFEDHVFEWIKAHPHPMIPGKEVRFLGAKQLVSQVPMFRFFTTNPEKVTPAFERYLMNKIYETYDFAGCPLVLEFKEAARPSRGRRVSRESVHTVTQEESE